MTNIKATWHPFIEGTFVIGRYDDSRSIDVIHEFDQQFEYVHRLKDSNVTTISPVNVFSSDGEKLATGSGYSTYVWESREVLEQHRKAVQADLLLSRKTAAASSRQSEESSSNSNPVPVPTPTRRSSRTSPSTAKRKDNPSVSLKKKRKD
mmetsp:Transcript_31390/g.50683  ORF Transcript_31390/g.50683 Transcript_31390/m.50683 type:complete len:150 (-) Transcript_31390:359-808(-)